jgi:hypothetical protein
MGARFVSGHLRVGWNPWARAGDETGRVVWMRDVTSVLAKATGLDRSRLRRMVSRGLDQVPVHKWQWMDRRDAACRLMENILPRVRRAQRSRQRRTCPA